VEIVGWIAIVIVALIAIALIVFLLMSIPDLVRYSRIRRM
jgi:hypothetical protein